MKVTPPPEYSAGAAGVIRSLRHISAGAGLIRGAKALAVLNQKGGTDCMSCAWPEPDGERRVAEFCESGAKAVAWEADSRLISASFFERYSVAELDSQSEYWMGQQGRLGEPMYLRPGATHYEPVSWTAAFRLIGRELRGLANPNEAIFYTSGRTSNEAAFLWQLLARRLGTNNLPDCSNMCHESSGVALTETIGIGKGTVTLDDFTKAQVILILGQNPGTNHPRMLTTLKRAKEAGAKIIAINPLIEPGLVRFKDPQEFSGIFGSGTALADLYLQVRINGDTALLKAIMQRLLRDDTVDRGFIAAKTTGWETLTEDLQRHDARMLLEQAGIPEEQVVDAAAMIGRADRIIACWAMGLTQQPNSTATIQEIVNLLLMRGSIGKPGAGVCPVRGHSNVQGDRTMGISEKPSPAFLDKLRDVFGFEPPRQHGYDTVRAIEAMHAGRAKVFLAMGGNFVSAAPDTEYTAAALRNTRLTVHVSTKLNRSHLVTGKAALILPCLGRTEADGGQFVTTENSMGVVESSRGTLRALSDEMKSEPAIVCGIAGALGFAWDAYTDDYDKIRELIAQCIPGFDDYNEKARRPGGFYLPNAPREGNFTGRFTVHPLPDHSLREGELVMMTIRSHDQFNTTVYGLDDVYRGIRGGRRVVFMNADDIAARGLKAGDTVNLHNGRRTAREFTVVAYKIPKGNCATYFPEANPLVAIDSVAAKSNTPASKYVRITVTPAG